jgi:hypothetical protein
MPTGPKGQKRPADVIGNAVHVMRIATGEIEDIVPDGGKDKEMRCRSRVSADLTKRSPHKFQSETPPSNLAA